VQPHASFYAVICVESVTMTDIPFFERVTVGFT